MLTLEFYIHILIATTTLLFAAHLTLLIPNPAKRRDAAKRLKDKVKKDKAGYYVASRVYTIRFLAAWVFITASSVLSVALDLYELSDASSPLVAQIGFILSMSVSVIGLYLLWLTFRKN